ncbi:hypothetical protein [Burkholderia anthina]|uniref:hypothetical protein n=1 Tax=Burkholderia anthina TaxID=179879 RepID=UPI001AA01D92|nr:hypothetical protein [Burkholderia anthina]QTD88064.1 hypothetical protein J4G50_09405 [Burkholderia anthina]
MLDTFMMLIATVFVRSRLASIDITEVFGSFSSWGGILPVPDRFEQVHFYASAVSLAKIGLTLDFHFRRRIDTRACPGPHPRESCRVVDAPLSPRRPSPGAANKQEQAHRKIICVRDLKLY